MSYQGFLDLPPWQVVLAALAMTHFTIVAVTLYLHRAQAHRALHLHPVVAHLFRFWLWLTTGMVTRNWVAVHRKHHAHCDTEGDPHSPQVFGIREIFWRGTERYSIAAKRTEDVERYGHGTPDDWLERNLYSRFSWAGYPLMLLIDLFLFGIYGVTVWALQMLWIPVLAAGVINGIGHYWGYRNFETPDASTNILPWGVLIGGEELHNNHHAFPASARLASRRWELDVGWAYIRLLSWLRLARVKRLAPSPLFIADKRNIDMDTLRALLVGRMHVIRRFSLDVLKPVTRSARSSGALDGSTSPRRAAGSAPGLVPAGGGHGYPRPGALLAAAAGAGSRGRGDDALRYRAAAQTAPVSFSRPAPSSTSRARVCRWQVAHAGLRSLARRSVNLSQARLGAAVHSALLSFLPQTPCDCIRCPAAAPVVRWIATTSC